MSKSIDEGLFQEPRSRRDFFRISALGLTVPAAGAVLAACSDGEVGTQAAVPPQAAGDHSGGTLSPHPATPESDRMKADEMDAMHEAGVKAFPAATEGKGNQILAPRMDNGVKVFDLTAGVLQWEVEPGRRVEAWAYSGQVPGPQIRVREGDRVRVNITNELHESTSIHFHGLEVPIDQDGVPFLTQPPIKPGTS